MRKIITFLCTLFLLGLGAQSMFAQLLMQEDFNYSLQTLLTNDNARWLAHSGAGTNPEQISDSNLTLSGAVPLVYPSSGKALVMKRTGQDVNYRFVATEADSITASTGSGVVYASFLVNIDTVNTSPVFNPTGDYFFHFGDYGDSSAYKHTTTMNTSDFWARVYVRKSLRADSGLTFGIARGALASNPNGYPQFSDSIYQRHTTYLLVVKYDFAGGDTSSAGASLYIFGQGEDWSVEPGSPNAGPAYGLPSGGAPQFGTGFCGAREISFVALRQGSATTAPYLVIDGIHVSQNWSDLALPVELTAFNASVSGKSVNLAWSTATEVNNSGFAVERKTTSTWSQVGFVDGHGTTNAPHNYSYVDAVPPGTYSYRLKQIDHDGKFQYSKEIEAAVALTPADYALGQNYPNPFNPTTTITFAVKTDQNASMKVYNMLGQEVMTLFDGDAKADQLYHVQFNASSLGSGTYFYVLQTGETRQVKKMVLLK